MAVQTLGLTISPEANLSRYLQEIRKFPMLKPEEEVSLSKAWLENEDHESAHQLVNSHLRLVAKIAMGYLAYGVRSRFVSESKKQVMRS